MLSVAFIMSAVLAPAAPAPHVTDVEHQGRRYEVTYQPHVRTRMKTIGLSAGPRPSTERCLWSVELQVTRRVEGVAVADRLLPATRTIEGSRHGNCSLVRKEVDAERARSIVRLEGRVAELAASDRHALLAEIATVHAVAAN